MDTLHRALIEALEEENNEKERYFSVEVKLQAQVIKQNIKIDDLTAKLDKVTAERDGLYNDLDAMEKENVMLRSRVTELDEQNNPHEGISQSFSADMDMCEPKSEVRVRGKKL